MFSNVTKFETVNSTIEVLKDFYQEFLEGDRELSFYEAVYSTHQTEGRGKSGSSWFSKPDKSLCFSVLLNFENDYFIAENIAEVMPITAQIVKDVLTQMFADFPSFTEKLRVKLPNDVYCGDLKLVGVLGELIDEKNNTSCIISAGINVNLENDELPFEKSTSLKIETGAEIDIHEFAREFSQKFIEKLALQFPSRNKE